MTAAKNAIVSWLLHFRIRMCLAVRLDADQTPSEHGVAAGLAEVLGEFPQLKAQGPRVGLDAAILDLPLFARRSWRIFTTSLTGDVTSEIAEDDWERGCFTGSKGHGL